MASFLYRNPYKNSISNSFDIHSSNYENFLLLVTFNAEMTNPNLQEFCNLYSLENLIKKPTCFKN